MVSWGHLFAGEIEPRVDPALSRLFPVFGKLFLCIFPLFGLKLGLAFPGGLLGDPVLGRPALPLQVGKQLHRQHVDGVLVGLRVVLLDFNVVPCNYIHMRSHHSHSIYLKTCKFDTHKTP